MQTKYPKKQKTKVVNKKVINKKNNIETTITEQQYQIEELKTMAIKADITGKSFQAKDNRLNAEISRLQEDFKVLDDYTTQAHIRLDNIDTQLDSIVQNGETNTVDLSTLTATVNNNISRIRTNELAIASLQNTDIQHDQDIDMLQNQITTLQNDINNSQSNVDLTEVFAKIDENTQSIADLNNNLGSQVAQNTEDIQNINTQINSLQVNTEMVLIDYDQLTATCQDLKTKVTQNQTNILTLQNQVDINTQKIEALQNDDTNTTELDLIDLTQKVETNKQDITALQTQQNINIADIAELMAFKQRFSTPTDNNYQPKSYSDYPAGTILQSYACYERELNITGSTKLTTPNIYFLAEEGSVGNLKLQFDLSTQAETGTVTIETYYNDELLNKEYFDIVQGNNTVNHNLFELALNTETKQNTFYFIIKYTSTVKATLNYLKAELFAPNADLINYTLPINVETIDGEYYISDCSDGTAKLATIKKEDLYNVDNLKFEDLGLEAQSFNIGFGLKNIIDKYEKDNVAYAYSTKQNNFLIYSTQNDKTNTNTNYTTFDWIYYLNTAVKFILTKIDKTAKSGSVYNSSGSMGFGSLVVKDTNVALTRAGKNIMNRALNYTAYITISADGKVMLYPSDSYATTLNLDLGYGTNARLYVVDARNYHDYDLKAYVKKFDKIVEYYLTFHYQNGITVHSTREIGTYDDIFLGERNDYFAVKNGKLSYHYFPTEEITEEKTTE